MNKELIKNWLINIPTNIENTNDVEYKKFIQLYFILNNFFCEIFPLNGCKHDDGKRMTEEFPKLIKEKWNNLDDFHRNEIKKIHSIMLRHIDFTIRNSFYITKDKKDIFFTELVKINYSEQNDTYVLTKTDAKLFKIITSFDYNDIEKIADMLKATLKIIYGVRNNYYHGSKRKLINQTTLLSYLNHIILKVLKILGKLKPELYNENINNQLEQINYEHNTNNISIKINYNKRNLENENQINNLELNNFNLLSELIDQKWNDKKDKISFEIGAIRLLMLKYIDYYISKMDIWKKTDTVDVGYLGISSFSHGNKKLTNKEIELFQNLIPVKYLKRKVNNQKILKKIVIQKILKTTSILLAYFETNRQLEINFLKNHILFKINKISFILQGKNEDENETLFTNQLKAILKKELKKYLNTEKSDFQNWEKLQAKNYYKFAFNFIILEKINTIIKRIIYSDKNIIENIEETQFYFETAFVDTEGKNINDYKIIYSQIFEERKNIFHGNKDTIFNSKKIDELNIKLENFIKQIYKWLKSISN